MHNILKKLIAPLYYGVEDLFDPFSRILLGNNNNLRDAFNGCTAYLICTGSSLNYLNLQKLRNTQSMCIGHIYLHKDIKKLSPKMFLLGETYAGIRESIILYDQYLNPLFPEYKDSYYFNRYQEYLSQKTSRDLWYCRKIDDSFPENSKVFAKREDYTFINTNKLYHNKDVYYSKYKGYRYFSKSDIRNYDISKRVYTFNAGSVTAALVTLIYMGFKKIFMIGSGYTMKPRLQFHFYDNFVFAKELGYERAYSTAKLIVPEINKRNNASVQLKGLVSLGNTYHAEYVQDFKIDSNSISHFRLNEMAKSNGIKIFNVTPKGFESPIYQELSMEDFKYSLGC